MLKKRIKTISQFFLLINKFNSIFIVFILLFSVHAYSQKAYEPIYGNPMTEIWRWTHFDEIVGKGVRCMTETANGTFVFGVKKGIITYDGITWEEFNGSNGFVDNTVLHLTYTDDSILYAGTNVGLFEFKNQKWKKIFPFGNQKNDKNLQVIVSLEKIAGGGFIASFRKGLVVYKNGRYNLFASAKTLEGIETSNNMATHIIPEDKCIDDIFAVEDVFQDREGKFWVWVSKRDITGHAFYFKWTQDNEERIEFSKLFTDSDGLIMGRDAKFEQDGKGNIWYINSSFHTGISVFNGKTWKQIKLKGENSFLSVTNVNGNMWIGGFGILYVYKNENWQIYKRPLTAIPSSKIFVFKDSQEYLWIIGIEGEVIRVDYSNRKWNSLKSLNYQCEDRDHNLWFIDVDGNIVVNNKENWYTYSTKEELPDAPVKIYCTKEGLICAAGSYKENACISFLVNSKWQRQVFLNLSWGIDNRIVYEDKEENLWIGSTVNIFREKGHRGGVVKIKNPGKPNQINTHYLPENGLQHTSPYGIGQTKDGAIWLGGSHVSSFKNNEWKHYSEIYELNSHINSMGNTPDGTLWLGSRQSGIFQLKNNNWSSYSVDNGLKSNTIISVLPISENDVWMATNRDFSRYDGKSWTTEIFHDDLNLSREGGNIQIQEDGTLWINRASRAWKRRALYNNWIEQEDRDYYSTIHFRTNTKEPQTKILVYSKKVPSTGNTVIEWEGIDTWKETPTSKLQYSYRLNNGEWSNFSKKTNATLLNLKNGKYTFEVRARDIDFNIDSTPAKATFTVMPPVWKQPWFIILIVFLLTVIFMYQYITLSQKKNLLKLNNELVDHGEEINRKNSILESQKEQILQQIVKEKEINQSKIRFFTNISHEFRTPLTLITGIIENISLKATKGNDQNRSEQLSVVQKNAKKLLHLINQLMDFRKLENDSMKLTISEIEIVSFIKNICSSFSEFAKKHHISCNFYSSIDFLIGLYDIEKIEKILYNLISNAIKFTSEGGSINIRVDITIVNGLNYLEVIIEDTGKGISENETSKIFEPFYQVNNAEDSKFVGTGIGLSIVHNYVKLHYGKLNVISSTDPKIQANRGYSTRFEILIPLDKSVYEGCEIIKHEQSTDLSIFLPTPINTVDVSDDLELHSKNYYELPGKRTIPHVLVVEDNDDLRNFMVHSLKTKFKILVAKNGSEGLDLAFSHMPDIIISDIMMPEMSGSELCQKIKGDIRTSHIPIILLTALTTDENKLEGYQIGADDYISKPFNTNLLIARIDNILSSRASLKKKIINEEVINPDEENVLSMDTKFLQKVKSVLEKNYSDPQFSVEYLSKEVGLSTRHLLLKLKNLIDQSPVEYIRVFRLKKAAHLLTSQEATISEIAYDTGFSDLSYFGKCFSKQFKMSPSEYVKRNYKGKKEKI